MICGSGLLQGLAQSILSPVELGAASLHPVLLLGISSRHAYAIGELNLREVLEDVKMRSRLYSLGRELA